MSKPIRMTQSTAVVLQALSNGHGYGFEIMDVTGLPGGTIYPALRRLQGADLVESEWEDGSVAQEQGRPARKYYRLTDAGAVALQEASKRFRVLGLLEAQANAGPQA